MDVLHQTEAVGTHKFYQKVPELGYTIDKEIPVIFHGEVTNYLCLRYVREGDESGFYHYLTTIDVVNDNMCICAPSRIYGNCFADLLDTLFRYNVDKIDIRKIRAFAICNDDDCYEEVDHSYYDENGERVEDIDHVFNEEKLRKRCLDEKTFRYMIRGLKGNYEKLIKEQMNFKYNKED